MGQKQSKQPIQQLYHIQKLLADNSVLLRNKITQKQYMLRCITSPNEEELEQYQKILSTHSEILKNQHILAPVEVYQKQENHICSIYYKIYILIQYSFKNLYQECSIRKITPKNHFSENEVWSILYSAVMGLNCMYQNNIPHECLSLDHIFISKDGFIKIGDPFVFGWERNHIKLIRKIQSNTNTSFTSQPHKPTTLHENNNLQAASSANSELQSEEINHIISPEILNCLEDQSFYYYDKEKSDIFILGVLMLEICLLKDIEVYDFNQKKPLIEKISECIEELKKTYQNQTFIQILVDMLHIQSKMRPSLTKIIDKIEKQNGFGDDFTVSSESQMLRNNLMQANNNNAMKMNNNNNAMKMNNNNGPASNNQMQKRGEEETSFNVLKDDKYKRLQIKEIKDEEFVKVIKKGPASATEGRDYPNNNVNNFSYGNAIQKNTQRKGYSTADIYNKDHHAMHHHNTQTEYVNRGIPKQLHGSQANATIITQKQDHFHSHYPQPVKKKYGEMTTSHLFTNPDLLQSAKALLSSNRGADVHQANSNKQYFSNQAEIYQEKASFANKSNISPPPITKPFNLYERSKSIDSIKLEQQQQQFNNHNNNNHSHNSNPFIASKQYPASQNYQSINNNQYQTSIEKTNQTFQKYQRYSEGINRQQHFKTSYQENKPAFDQLENQNYQYPQHSSNYTQEYSHDRRKSQYSSLEKQKKFAHESKAPIFTYEIPEVYNLMMKNTKQSFKAELISPVQKQLLIENTHVSTPQFHGEMSKINRFNNFKNFAITQNINKCTNVDGDFNEVDYPSFQIKKKQSEKYDKMDDFLWHKKEVQSFSNIEPGFNISGYANKNDAESSFTCRSGFSHFAHLRRAESKNQENVEFVNQEIPERGRYAGYKSNKMRNGQGTLYFTDGGHYEGEWKDDKMHGFGKLYYDNNKIAYEGHWELDEFSGQGRVYNNEPKQFSGEFNYKDFSELSDKWIYYEGHFKSDAKHGKGYIKLTSGEMFEGVFDRDMIEGNGVFYKKDGAIIIGYWIDNKLFLNQSYQNKSNSYDSKGNQNYDSKGNQNYESKGNHK